MVTLSNHSRETLVNVVFTGNVFEFQNAESTPMNVPDLVSTALATSSVQSKDPTPVNVIDQPTLFDENRETLVS